MNDSDKTNFARLLTTLAELHNKKISQHLLRTYWHALKHYEYNDVLQSLNRLIVDPDVGQFMPKPADVVRYIEGDSETKAMAAWSKVMLAIYRHGAWASVEFDDHRIHAVINDIGGWIELCRKTAKELSYLSREFESRYCTYLRHDSGNYPKRLVGKIESQGGREVGSSEIKTKFIGSDVGGAAMNRLGYTENN